MNHRPYKFIIKNKWKTNLDFNGVNVSKIQSKNLAHDKNDPILGQQGYLEGQKGDRNLLAKIYSENVDADEEIVAPKT